MMTATTPAIGERFHVEGRRHYWTGDRFVPSVTTILSGTQAPEKKEGLDRWRDKLRRQGIDPVVHMDKICDQGTQMHTWAEMRLCGKPESIAEDPRVKGLIKSIEPLVMSIGEVHAQEEFVHHPLGYAGSFDCLGTWNEQLNVIDFKSSQKPKKPEWVGDYVLQMAAYAAGIYQCRQQRIQGGVILMGVCSQEAVALEGQVFAYSREDLLSAWQQWQIRVKQYWAENPKMPTLEDWQKAAEIRAVGL